MANCYKHVDKEGSYICSKCWLSFCSACFDQENKVCKGCLHTLGIKHDKAPVRNSVVLFAAASLVLALLLVASLFATRKPSSTNFNTASEKKGNTSKSEKLTSSNTNHFVIKKGDNSQAVKSKGEDYYQSIPLITGLPSGETLGLDEIGINIFASKDDYVRETGKPSWSEGYADYKSKEIYIIENEGLVISILPHEISHLFFDGYMEYESAQFNWLDEGLATLVQVKYDTDQAASFNEAMQALRNNGHIPLTQLTTYVLTQQTPATQINKYYAESLSVTHFLVKKDFEKWKLLLEKLKSKKKFNQALKESFDLNLSMLEQEWLASIKASKQSWEKD